MPSIESQILPTVKVVSEHAPDGWVVINQSDLMAHHQLLANGVVPVQLSHAGTGWVPPGPLRVAKGARGKFYVKRGKETLTVGLDSEAGAHALLGSLSGESSG